MADTQGTWVTWRHGTGGADVARLVEMVFDLMGEATRIFPDPDADLDEWADAGIEIEGSPAGDESVLVFHEMQETGDGMAAGYTLTVMGEDGQQDTEAFFAADYGRWLGIAERLARRIAYA